MVISYEKSMGQAFLGCSDNQVVGSRLKSHTILHHISFLLQNYYILVSNFNKRGFEMHISLRLSMWQDSLAVLLYLLLEFTSPQALIFSFPSQFQHTQCLEQTLLLNYLSCLSNFQHLSWSLYHMDNSFMQSKKIFHLNISYFLWLLYLLSQDLGMESSLNLRNKLHENMF